MSENGLPSTGIPYVIVNGTIVVDNSKALSVKPGQAIRYPVDRKGRCEPVEVNTHIRDFTINTAAIPVDDTAFGQEVKRH